MKVLVTGAAGFIGSHLVNRLLAGHEGTRVTVLDAFTYAGNPANLAGARPDPALRVVAGDIRDAELVDRLVPGHDAIVNLAAETHVDRSITGSAPFVTTNVMGTQVLLDAALRHRVGRFLQVSTDEVYGSLSTGSWREDAPVAPRSPYSASKAGADLLALAYWHTHSLPVLVTRASNTFGPNQHPEKFVPRFVSGLLDGQPVPLYGDGLQVRDWMHVEDHCRGLELVLRDGRPGQIYHLGAGHELTNAALASRLVALTGADPGLVRPATDRKGHDRRYALDTSRARTELGFAPRVGFGPGLAATVEWYRSHRDW